VDFRFVLISLIALPLGLVAFVIAAQAWRGQRQANAARVWPSTTGWVISSGVRETTVRQRIRTSTSRYRMATRYAPRVIYSYEVNGSSYQSERLFMGDSLLTSEVSEAEREAARFPVGDSVTVYYHPANPAEATLDPRPGWGTRVLWLTALTLLVMTLAIIIFIVTSPPIPP
jgi:hypothetical protein